VVGQLPLPAGTAVAELSAAVECPGLLLVLCRDGTVQLWQISSGACLWSCKTDAFAAVGFTHSCVAHPDVPVTPDNCSKNEWLNWPYQGQRYSSYQSADCHQCQPPGLGAAQLTKDGPNLLPLLLLLCWCALSPAQAMHPSGGCVLTSSRAGKLTQWDIASLDVRPAAPAAAATTAAATAIAATVSRAAWLAADHPDGAVDCVRFLTGGWVGGGGRSGAGGCNWHVQG
jgi:hypothetical protein